MDKLRWKSCKDIEKVWLTVSADWRQGFEWLELVDMINLAGSGWVDTLASIRSGFQDHVIARSQLVICRSMSSASIRSLAFGDR